MKKIKLYNEQNVKKKSNKKEQWINKTTAEL